MTTPKQEGLNGPDNNGLNGHVGSRHRWEITKLRRVSGDPAAWSGITADGFPVHVSCLHGNLRIEIAEPSRTHPGGTSWRDLLVVRPDYIELELDLLHGRGSPPDGDTRSRAVTQREQHTVADWFILGECKADRRTKTPRMNFWRLCTVLETRDANLAHLLRAGVAGGHERVIITALMEGDPLPHNLREKEPGFLPRNGDAP